MRKREQAGGGRASPHGRIAPEDFRSACQSLSDFLAELRDKRSGRPMVAEIIRTRDTPFENPDSGPPADLIVLWQEHAASDWVTHPQAGDIGPLPFFRTGGHCSTGFLAARGEGIARGTRLSDVKAVALTAMLLDWLGQPIPPHIRSRALL